MTMRALDPDRKMTGMTTWRERQRGSGTARLAWLAIWIAVLGAILLLAVAVVEVATGPPGLSIVDAYWIGRLPWTPIGVGMVVFGASAAILSGSVAAWLRPRLVARLLSVPAVLAGALWWSFASIGGYTGACCGGPAWDPLTAAYSSPQSALLLLALPALVLGLAVRTGRPHVESAGPGADPWRTVSGA